MPDTRDALRTALLVTATGALAPAAATAAPPPNDAAVAAAPFEAYATANGRPRELQAVAALAEATADGGVPRCLGTRSFARSAWYRIPPAPVPQEIAVDAIGRTLDVLDIAAFVQPAGADAALTRIANACAGAGAGGSSAAEEATAGISLRVGAGHAVLIEVARRGAPGPPEDERALLSLDARPLPLVSLPSGDAAGAATPFASGRRGNRVGLGGATIGERDPARPSCPSLGTVWRRFVPGSNGHRLVSVSGRAAATLAVFAGSHPTAANGVDCVVRAGRGSLQMRVPVRRHRPLWIRIGTASREPAARAILRAGHAGRGIVVDGGPGGFDPTPGGAGGGLPGACEEARATRARVTGALGGLSRRGGAIVVRARVRRSALCDVRLALVGPGGRVYAAASAVRLRGRPTLRLERSRALVRGRYRLSIEAASELGGRVAVRSSVHGRLR